jgi:large subunit ribosomal protein L6
MSRIGKQPIKLPAGVTATPADGRVSIRGPKGELSLAIRPEVAVEVEGSTLSVRPAKATRRASAYWGLTRALLKRMVEGVTTGFEKKLEIEGVGYRAATDGAVLQLSIGFSHPVRIEPPPGIAFQVEKNVITVAGIDPVIVGDTAARIRRVRPPEPYKGKGIRYAGEVIRRKVGKKAVAAGA